MYRVLLVDDEPNILSALRRTLGAINPAELQGQRLELECFTDPCEALARAATTPFDLAISDYRMPVMNGVEFLKALIEKQPQIARLTLSGYADLEAVIAAINETQIYRFIGKPWHDEDLRSAVLQALRHRALLLENQRLADLVRVQQKQLSRHEAALRQLEQRYPGLAKVTRDEDGAIVIDEADADAVDPSWMVPT
jgi:DNA-binding NtrC family response regulator